MENNIDTSTKAYYESKIEELTVKKPKLSIEEIEQLARDITAAMNDYIIEDYGINPIFDFNDEEDGAYDVVYNKIHEKYGI